MTHVRVSLIVLVVAAALAARSVSLGRVPGINGDETYYPVAAMNVRDGRSQALVSGSGLPLNPLYIGPVYLLHAAHPAPSFTLVRLTALVSGLLVLALMYPIAARVLDRQSALYATLLLASLPAAIAYSRFGWDQSQAPLIALLCLYCAFRNWPIRLAICYLLALWIHPINMFLAPILMGPIAARDLAKSKGRPNVATWKVAAVAGLAAAGLGVLAGFSPTIRDAAGPALGRLIDPAGWLRYAVAVGDLLSGLTIYRFVAGEPSAAWVIAERSVFWLSIAFLLVRVVPTWTREKDGPRLGLLGGLVVALAGFYLLMGPEAISPGWERYGMWLISPACVVLGLLLSGVGTSSPSRAGQTIAVGAVCLFLLLGFYRNYFAVFETTGGTANWVFRTGPVEPKQAAFDEILAMTSGASAPVTILAEDWWTYYPMRYLAAERPTIDVVWPEDDTHDQSATAPRHRFAVGAADGRFHRWIDQHAPELPRRTTLDASGRPVLTVWDLANRADLQQSLVDAAGRGEER